MEILSHPDQVRSVVGSFAKTHGPVVIHGTTHAVNPNYEVTPSVCTLDCTNMQGEPIAWPDFPPYIFAAMPDHPDLAIFVSLFRDSMSTRDAGVRDISTDPDMTVLTYRASDEAKAKVRSSLATLCILPAATFERSPNGSWAERVSEANVRAIGVFGISSNALSFDLGAVPPEFPVS